MILVIDNYDSFTYNLVQYLGELGADLKVVRNDALTVDDIRKLNPSRIVISPGPGNPSESGVSRQVILELGPQTPVLGVCLGHQCIGEVFGGTVTHAPSLMHGKTSPIYHDGSGVFQSLANPFTATRYHSLIVAKSTVPSCLKITAWTEDELVMGLSHINYPIHGIQFHPESILTESGKTILQNFLTLPGF